MRVLRQNAFLHPPPNRDKSARQIKDRIPALTENPASQLFERIMSLFRAVSMRTESAGQQ
jgi:hypothetical protein